MASPLAGGTLGQLAAQYTPLSGIAIGAPYSWRIQARFNNPYFPTSHWESPVRNGVREYGFRDSGTTWVDVPTGAGVFFVRVQSDGKQATRKIARLR